MRTLLNLAAFVLLFVMNVTASLAFEIIPVPDTVNSVNLTSGVDIVQGDGSRIQVSTAPGADGIIRRIEVPAAVDGTTPSWALFALSNETDVQIERLLVAPFFRLPGSGIVNPDLGAERITVVTVNAGLRPVRIPDAEADVFEITLDPGATVTFIAELSSGELPELYLWNADSYRNYVNAFTLFRGTVLGISSLAAIFLTIMFVVKGSGVFPATAAFSWAVLAYLLIDFGVLGSILGIGNGSMQPFRAAAEAAIATTLFGFLFIYLNLHRWHLRFVHLALALAAVFFALFAFAFFQPEISVTIARFVLVLLGIMGFFVILLLSLRGYDRAVLMVPTWIIFIAWLFYGWMVVSGRVVNDVAQPAVAGGLVLIVMLIGFTAVQHAFAEGQVSIGTLSEVERRALALTGSGDFVFDWNTERDRVQVSEELASRLGIKRSALRGSILSWIERAHPEDRDKFKTALDTLIEMRRGKVNADIRLSTREGAHRTFRMRVKPVLGNDGEVNRVVGTLQDVSDERAARERLLHDSVNDSLTGLPNKELFLDRLDRALERSRHGVDAKPAVLLIDIDKFADVEERIGQAAGDSVLLAVARRITRLVRPLDTVARLNGDQFGVILCAEQTASKIAEVAEQLRNAIRAPFAFGERDMTLTASVGITIFDNGPATAPEVLRDAELAMYYAKRHGGNRIEAYRAAARSITEYKRTTEEDLQRAMKVGELQMFFQPINEVSTRRIIGAEALMRWVHPVRGMISPEEFVPLAERSGLIDELGKFAFEKTAEQMQSWRRGLQLPDEFFVSVNLSPNQLSSESLLSEIKTTLGRFDNIAKHLTLELTESEVMVNPEHSAYVLSALKALGLRLALDDFGTGHSSLSYLHRFPFDTIKIAAPFVQISDNSGFAHTQVPIIRAVVGLATELDLLVIAEGIETEEELNRLAELGCKGAQGFFFSKPITGLELRKMLASQILEKQSFASAAKTLANQTRIGQTLVNRAIDAKAVPETKKTAEAVKPAVTPGDLAKPSEKPDTSSKSS